MEEKIMYYEKFENEDYPLAECQFCQKKSSRYIEIKLTKTNKILKRTFICFDVNCYRQFMIKYKGKINDIWDAQQKDYAKIRDLDFLFDKICDVCEVRYNTTMTFYQLLDRYQGYPSEAKTICENCYKLL